MAYTHKHVNGVLTPLNAADQTALASRDAADWGQVPAPGMMGTVAERLARMLKTHGLTLAQLKSELGL